MTPTSINVVRLAAELDALQAVVTANSGPAMSAAAVNALRSPINDQDAMHGYGSMVVGILLAASARGQSLSRWLLTHPSVTSKAP